MVAEGSNGNRKRGGSPSSRPRKTTPALKQRGPEKDAPTQNEIARSDVKPTTVQARIDVRTVEFCEKIVNQKYGEGTTADEVRTGGLANLRRAAEIGRLYLPLHDGTIPSGPSENIGTLSQEQWVAQILPSVLLAVRELERRGISVASFSFEQVTRLAIVSADALAETMLRQGKGYSPTQSPSANPTTGELGDPSAMKLGENMSNLMGSFGGDLE